MGLRVKNRNKIKTRCETVDEVDPEVIDTFEVNGRTFEIYKVQSRPRQLKGNWKIEIQETVFITANPFAKKEL